MLRTIPRNFIEMIALQMKEKYSQNDEYLSKLVKSI